MKRAIKDNQTKIMSSCFLNTETTGSPKRRFAKKLPAKQNKNKSCNILLDFESKLISYSFTYYDNNANDIKF